MSIKSGLTNSLFASSILSSAVFTAMPNGNVVNLQLGIVLAGSYIGDYNFSFSNSNAGFIDESSYVYITTGDYYTQPTAVIISAIRGIAGSVSEIFRGNNLFNFTLPVDTNIFITVRLSSNQGQFNSAVTANGFSNSITLIKLS